MSGVNEIRDEFLNFFKGRGHELVSSSPLVPMNDPTLMFTNAGMVQFKNYFTGAEAAPYPSAVTSQKCVRAGGKHNDLDNVGYTARHHTFFEMLGNFSFGDYFKAGAIESAWDLLTKVYAIPADRLTVTVYHTDDEAYDLWRKIAGVPADRIIRIPTKDNFWAMGDTGPCGPCSEIFYDHGDHIPGGPPGSADEDGDRFVEIWNLVFMQFEQVSADERIALPKPSIDTGMGLERIAAVLQGTHDNYQIDTFRHLIGASVDLTGVAAEGDAGVGHRVIADHLRASSFLVADGVLPSNEGRGYVLRRIMRRAMRFAHVLGARDPLMYRLVPTLVTEMGAAYPELRRAQPLIEETLKLEETRFRQTLERGLKLLGEASEDLARGDSLPGDVAFKLYDTFGFPYDLTEDALRREGKTVDRQGFDAAMDAQKAMARASWAGSGEAATDEIWFDVREKSGATDFLGYDATTAEGQITALVVDGAMAEAARAGETVALIANQTPFYGESGGQAGDAGTITTTNGAVIQVDDTRKQMGDMHVHQGTVMSGEVAVGEAAIFKVNADRRNKLRANHSATHLLHKALRDVLGAHVTQKGSLVAPDYLRFDLSHNKALAAGELVAVERAVNRQIRANTRVTTRLMTPDDAIAAGAMALFGEKYGDEVRVLAMGVPEGDEETYSVELCGGTHVRRTGDIGFFKITEESAVSSGVRRIGAVTGDAALDYVLDQQQLVNDAAAEFKCGTPAIAERAKSSLQKIKALEKELAETKKQLALGGGGAAGSQTEVRDAGGVKFHGQALDGVSPKDLRALADDAKANLGSGIVVLIAVNDDKAAILVGVTDDLISHHSAVDLVRIGAEVLGGKGGGGRPDMAQAGGPNGAKAEDAIEAIFNSLSS